MKVSKKTVIRGLGWFEESVQERVKAQDWELAQEQD